ncbi:MAG: glycosyltransferase [Sandaracinaceae bacterium]|nr:glycosyltransferase [Sandaracinaceae bacterium]
MGALVSVILPYRDVEDTLHEALRSVLAQEAVELEVLAIDDGSRDGSAAVVRELAARDARVSRSPPRGRGWWPPSSSAGAPRAAP